jgi:hypothetical protein
MKETTVHTRAAVFFLYTAVSHLRCDAYWLLGYENLWYYILLSGIVYHRRRGELWMAPSLRRRNPGALRLPQLGDEVVILKL